MAMESCLREAIDRGCDEFDVLYRPLFGPDNQTCLGAKAVVKWNSGELGSLDPADFMPAAEASDMLDELTAYVLRNTCRKCKHWNDFGNPDFAVVLKTPVAAISNDSIVKIIRNTLKDTGINPANLKLEVIDHAGAYDRMALKKTIRSIEDSGVDVIADEIKSGLYNEKDFEQQYMSRNGR